MNYFLQYKILLTWIDQAETNKLIKIHVDIPIEVVEKRKRGSIGQIPKDKKPLEKHQSFTYGNSDLDLTSKSKGFISWQPLPLSSYQIEELNLLKKRRSQKNKSKKNLAKIVSNDIIATAPKAW